MMPILTQADHEAARRYAETRQQDTNLSQAYLEICGVLDSAEKMIEARDRMIDVRSGLLYRALPMLSGAGASDLAAEICECLSIHQRHTDSNMGKRI